jgi:Ni,Fe-hydrogenase III small subunit
VIEAATQAPGGLAWADDPLSADTLLITGPVTPVARPAFLALLRQLEGHVPLVVVGRCAIDGRPFGRAGLAELPDIDVAMRIDGCPVTVEQVREAVQQVVEGRRRRSPAGEKPTA